MDQPKVPDGYMRNAQGHLVPLDLVKPVDQERDRLVRELVAIAKDLNARLVASKTKIFGDVAAFAELHGEHLRLRAWVGSAADGSGVSAMGEGVAGAPQALGQAVATDLLALGAARFLG